MAEVDRIIQDIAQRLGMSASQARKAYTLDPFTFVISFLPLAASASSDGQFITQADSGFAIVKTAFTISDSSNVYDSDISDTPKYAPQVITLSDSGSGRDLSNAPVSINNYFGTGQEPFLWCRAKILDPNSTFTAKIQNLVATAFNIRLAFHGFKIFGDVTAFRGR
jgi:hypothetical protein